MAKISKKLVKYTKTLLKRAYRPVKPVVSPLLKKVKMWQVLGVMLLIGLAGVFSNGFEVKSFERASWWPFSSKSHAQMAVFWFEAGDENKALVELEKANKTLILKTERNLMEVRQAEEKVNQPGEIRDEIKFYEEVIETKPYFRDVLLRLVVLNFMIYDDEKAMEYFKRAEYLDPNKEEIKQVREIIFPMQSLD